MAVRAVIDGRIVAEPETKVISDKFSVIEFPLYSDRRVKNKESGEWESDQNGTSKIKVSLKFDLKDEFDGVLHKGDIIKLTGTIYERGYETKDGTKGRSLETDYIESIEVIKSYGETSGSNAVTPPW